MLHKSVEGNPVAKLENIQEILSNRAPNPATQKAVSEAQAEVAGKLKENFYSSKK